MCYFAKSNEKNVQILVSFFCNEFRIINNEKLAKYSIINIRKIPLTLF